MAPAGHDIGSLKLQEDQAGQDHSVLNEDSQLQKPESTSQAPRTETMADSGVELKSASASEDQHEASAYAASGPKDDDEKHATSESSAYANDSNEAAAGSGQSRSPPQRASPPAVDNEESLYSHQCTEERLRTELFGMGSWADEEQE